MTFFESIRSTRYQPLVILAVLYVVLSAVLRPVLWLAFGGEASVSTIELLLAVLVGVLTDTIQLVYILALPAIFLFAVSDRIYNSAVNRYFLDGFLYLACFGLVYLCAVEFFFFEEFDSRFNLVAVDYLMYPTEVFINLWDSYPIVWFFLGSLIIAALIFGRVRPHFHPAPVTHSRFALRTKILLLHILLIALVTWTISSDSFHFSANRVTNQIASSGISSFFRALRTDELDYDLYYRTIEPQHAFAIMRGELSNGGVFDGAGHEDLNRSFAARADGLGKLNIVVIGEESLGAGFVGALGDRRGLTPHFDHYSKLGLHFTNAYATGTRTVRGLEAISASFPPIPSEAILKRPGSEGIANWGAVMNRLGYESLFLYGGFSRFDNMGYYFSSNGFRISDRFDIKNQTFANIWGACDQDLFRHAISEFDRLAAEKKPFFSIVMSTSNHKPFTFPPGVPDVPERGGGREAGVRYADYAVGELLRSAAGKPWFDDTIFIIVADHDARVYGRSYIPLERYRIPLLIFAPKHVAPGVVDTLTSQIDIAPTILGMLGLPYRAPFYGQDVLHLPRDVRRSILVNHNHSVAIYREGVLGVLGLNKSVQSFSYDPATARQEPIENDPQLIDLATSYFQTGYQLFHQQRYK